MHRRERDHAGVGASEEEDFSPPSPSRLPSLGLDSVGSNPLLLAEQLYVLFAPLTYKYCTLGLYRIFCLV